jgi:hypothetical protein
VQSAQLQDSNGRVLVVDDIVLVLTVSAAVIGAGATLLEQIKRFVVAAKEVGKELGVSCVSVEGEERLVPPEELTETDAQFLAAQG